MPNEIKAVIKQICAEKGLSEESVIETINSALAAAFRKDFGEKNQNIVAEFDVETGKTVAFDVKEVVEDLTPEELAEMDRIRLEREALKEKIASGEISADELRHMREERDAQQREEDPRQGGVAVEGVEDGKHKFNPKTDIQISDAKKLKKSYKLGDIVRTGLDIPGDFGRMAAQTAKQVIIQKLREAERNINYQDYKAKEGQIVTGMVQKFEGYNIIIDLDKSSAILPPAEQIRTERFRIGDCVKVYIASGSLTTRGPEIIVSRAHPKIVEMLFGIEIPEIANGTIEIKGIAREAGGRTKIAVYTAEENIDPIGSCIGQRGARIQTIIHELGGEKIDIIEYSDDARKFIGNALLPAKVSGVELNEADRSANVTVPAEQLSLTIGRAGQNVRLASKLTGWRINIREKETGKAVAEAVSTDGVPADAGVPAEVKLAEEAKAVVEPVVEEKPKKRGRKKKAEGQA